MCNVADQTVEEEKYRRGIEEEDDEEYGWNTEPESLEKSKYFMNCNWNFTMYCSISNPINLHQQALYNIAVLRIEIALYREVNKDLRYFGM